MYAIQETVRPTTVEILKLGAFAKSGLTTARGWKPFSILDSKKVAGDQAEYLWAMWKELPHGEPMRCHTPPFGMRFFRDAEVYLECSLCWECNTIFIVTAGSFDFFHFDASKDDSRRLLATLWAYILN